MKNRILFVNHLPLGSASSYRQVGFAGSLSSLGFISSLLCRSSPAGKGGLKTEDSQWSAFSQARFWSEPLPAKFFSNVSKFKEEERRADIIWVNRSYPYTAAIVSMDLSASRSLVVDMEDWDGFGGYSSFAHLYNPRGALLTVAESLLPRRARLVTVVSRLLHARMRTLGVPDSRLILLPNGFDESLFDSRISGKETRARYGLGTGPVIMYTSTFWGFEGALHETAIGTFKAISKEVPEAKFIVTGPGDFPFRQRLATEGLSEKVVFTGYVPRSEVPRLMAAADLAVHVISEHPFHQASSPMVIPEYMAMGKAIVAPRVGEIGSMLGGGRGVLVKKPEPEELAAAAVGLLRDERTRVGVGELARRRALDEFSYRVLSKRVGQRLQELG